MSIVKSHLIKAVELFNSSHRPFIINKKNNILSINFDYYNTKNFLQSLKNLLIRFSGKFPQVIH